MADTARIDDLRRRLDREPGSRVFAQLAEELRKAGQLPEAIRVARQGLLVHPGYPSARMTLGRALMDLRDLRGARAEFEAVLRGANDNILASRFLGECLEGLGDLGSALLQFRATLRLAPGDRNLEAQIRALELKLSPSSAGVPLPAPAQPPPSRPPLLPREGAIPVLDVDGPMELESSFDKTMAWRPPVTAPAAAPPSASLPPVEQPGQVAAGPGEEPGDNSPPVILPDQLPDDLLAPEGVSFEAEVRERMAGQASPSPAPESAVESLNESFPEEEPWPAAEAGPVEPAAVSDAPPLSSSTLAELYFNQGFTQQAIDVYKELLEREPGNERIAARILELQAIERELGGGTAPPPLPASDPRARRREALERTIMRLEGFLATVRRA